ncbi:MAG: phenylalanine--tRNA ligase subunit beta [Thermoguttaceae bacterium]
MKISLDWVCDFVDLSGIEPAEIADRLTLATAEVEGFEVLHRSVEGVVIGEIVAVEPIGGEAKLHLVTVDCGKKRYQSVCGAPNVRLGMKAPFAPAGVTIAEGHKIAVSQVGGHKSEGVLCSAAELGMSHWHEGLLECPASLANGPPLADLVPPTDVIIEIDNKSLTHRPDLWGHYAFARELAAIFERPLRPLPVVDLSAYDRLPAYPLSIDDLDGCPCYGCVEFSVQGAVPSPLVMQRRLHALGQRTYNLLVDVTNYVMLELAQPTHAFDAARLKAVRVAKLGKPGVFVTLDGQQRKLVADDLLIWNEKEPVALAGIMGGLNSEVQPTTTRMLLEAANVKGSRVRRTSVRLDLRTDAAQRFEKSQPPINVKRATARILQVIADAGVKCEVLSRFTVKGDLKEAFRPLTLPAGRLDTFAGVELPKDKVLSILHALGFQAKYEADGSLAVGIPPFRSEKDISIPVDLAEEVMRVYGYAKIKPRMPEAPLKPLPVNELLQAEHKIQRLLTGGHRFIEVQNYVWTDEQWLAEIGYQPGQTLELKNPAAQQNRLLRTTMMPNLLKLVPQNRPHRESFRLFEVGRVYFPTADGGRDEKPRVAGVSFNQSGQPSLEEHFRAIKGVLEDLAQVTGAGQFTFAPSMATLSPWQVANHWVEVRKGDQLVGGLGVLSDAAIKAVVPEGGQVVWFELDTQQLQGPLYPAVRYAPLPRYPGSWQDFSLVWDLASGFAGLEERLQSFSQPLVTHREFLYAYKGKGMPAGKGSFTYRFWLSAPDRTLSSEEIDQFRNALLAFLQAEGIPLR